MGVEAEPILGDGERCVSWLGEVHRTHGLPVVDVYDTHRCHMTKTYVTRVLVFLYAGQLLVNQPPVPTSGRQTISDRQTTRHTD